MDIGSQRRRPDPSCAHSHGAASGTDRLNMPADDSPLSHWTVRVTVWLKAPGIQEFIQHFWRNRADPTSLDGRAPGQKSC
jgi:hypothetical protein